MKNPVLSILILIAAITTASAQDRYVGGDVSLLPLCVDAGAKYYDHTGKPVASFLPWCREEGMNAMRVRLFVNPDKYKQKHPGDADPNACQDMDYILPLCRDIVDAGLNLMLDFHYSDTWADPAKQWTPVEWEGLTDEQLYDKIYEYTRDCLLQLKEAGVTPAFIQPGNEISYGMLWGPAGTSAPKKTLMGSNANWDRLGHLLNRAIEACREVCPDAKIVIHTERTGQPSVLLNFYEMMDKLGVGYDIIGLSYYPFWHGDMAQLDSSLTKLSTRFPDKNIMIVETGYALKWQVPYSGIIDHTSTWPISDAGQKKFAQDLVDTLEKFPAVNGLFWWWMEYNPYNTKLTGWYNAPLFDPTNGRASSAFKVICSFGRGGAGITDITGDSGATLWYDINGQRVGNGSRGLRISNHGEKIYVK